MALCVERGRAVEMYTFVIMTEPLVSHWENSTLFNNDAFV